MCVCVCVCICVCAQVKELQKKIQSMEAQIQEVEGLKHRLLAEQRTALDWREKWNYQVRTAPDRTCTSTHCIQAQHPLHTRKFVRAASSKIQATASRHTGYLPGSYVITTLHKPCGNFTFTSHKHCLPLRSSTVGKFAG